ncbi:MAG: sugar phosphate isomerase/epimerase [Propionibacteriaceae bacterium]|jgi:D-psicose/D-tagatose/L-ribulose 3-epimerase|nr:sugar phosphate isomerase/epimerase [Propionibacteriaceae bacterium]
MNPVGIHVLVWTGESELGELTQALRATAEAGYDFMELSLHQMDILDPAGLKAAAAASGLELTCSRGLAFDADISSPDPAIVARGADLLSRSIDVTAEMGAKVLTGPIFSALGKYGCPLSAAGRANAVTALRDAARHAASARVTLGLEVCNRYETNVVNTARDARRLADDVGEDNVKVHLDTYHMNIEEDNLYQPVIDAGERLGYVHIGENHRGPLGTGHIDLPLLFEALAHIGYAGPIAFESFSSEVVSAGLSNDLAIWRNLWADNVPMAQAAAAHIRSLLRGQELKAQQ